MKYNKEDGGRVCLIDFGMQILVCWSLESLDVKHPFESTTYEGWWRWYCYSSGIDMDISTSVMKLVMAPIQYIQVQMTNSSSSYKLK